MSLPCKPESTSKQSCAVQLPVQKSSTSTATVARRRKPEGSDRGFDQKKSGILAEVDSAIKTWSAKCDACWLPIEDGLETMKKIRGQIAECTNEDDLDLLDMRFMNETNTKVVAKNTVVSELRVDIKELLFKGSRKTEQMEALAKEVIKVKEELRDNLFILEEPMVIVYKD